MILGIFSPSHQRHFSHSDSCPFILRRSKPCIYTVNLQILNAVIFIVIIVYLLFCGIGKIKKLPGKADFDFIAFYNKIRYGIIVFTVRVPVSKGEAACLEPFSHLIFFLHCINFTELQRHINIDK